MAQAIRHKAIGPDHEPPTVAFLPYGETSFARMLPQLRALHGSSTARPHVILASPRVMQFEDTCRQLGVATSVVGPMERHDRGEFPWLERRVHHDRIQHGLALGLIRLGRVRRRLEAERQCFANLFAAIGARAVFVQGDRELGPNPGALAAAGMIGMPRVIVSPGVPSVRAMAVLRRGQPRFAAGWRSAPPLLNVIAKARYPDQVRNTDFGRILFSPGWLTLALGAAGMLSHNPWCLGGGHSDFVLMDSARKHRQFVELGINPDKLVMIGDLDLDELHQGWQQRQATRSALVERHGLDPDRELTVFAVPVYGEHALMAMDRHVAELEHMFAAIAVRRGPVVLSLHPRARREAYDAMATRHGFVIAEERLSRLLPAADLFLCGSSSTIEWAVLCGVPTINIDYCGLDDDLFHRLGSVIRVETADALSGVLARLAGDRSWRAQLVAAQRQAADGQVLFDGRAHDRFLDFVAGLARRGDAGRTGVAA